MKINKLLITLYVIILLSFSLVSIPKTTSKYVSENTNHTTYNAKFYRLYQGEKNTSDFISLDIERSNTEYAYFDLYFPYINFDAVGLSNYYTFSISPNTCSLESFNDTPSTSNIADNILLNNHATIKCSMNNSVLDLNIRLHETINNETTFLYMDFAYSSTYNEYLESILLRKTILKDGNVIPTINMWMIGDEDNLGYTTKYEVANSSYVSNYLLGYITNKDTLESSTIKGINKTCNETSCILEIEENFVGYAYTKANYYNNFYFTITDEDIIEEAFEYYLSFKSYEIDSETVSFTNEEIAEITEYVDGKLLSVLAGETTLPGITLNNDGSINILYDILSYAKIFKTYATDGYYRLYYSDNNTMRKSFELILETMTFNSGNTENIIKSDSGLISCYLTKGKEQYNYKFMNMYVTFDGTDENGKYIIFVIGSDGVDNNKVKVYILDYTDNIESIILENSEEFTSIYGEDKKLTMVVSTPIDAAVTNFVDNNINASRIAMKFYSTNPSYTNNGIAYKYNGAYLNMTE